MTATTRFTAINVQAKFNRGRLWFSAVGGAILGASLFAHASTVRLDELDLTAMTAGWGKPQPNLSIMQKPLTIGGVKFDHGVGTHAESGVTIQLDGKAKWFTAKVGVDGHANNAIASVEFIVSGDDRELWRSGVCKWGEQPRNCRVKLDGVKSLELEVTDADDGISHDHADWADATFEFNGAAPQTVKNVVPAEDAVVLTPAAPREPRINGPKIYGVRPGSPFLYRVPCTGERPLLFRANDLPDGLTLNSSSGIITGKITKAGTYRATLFARNAFGSARREFRIEVGNKLALTPPMGWNSWYIHYDRVSEATMRNAADQMIASGMADYGYQYVNIDDCWLKKRGDEPYRDADGAVLPNGKFSDMKGLADYIHGKGLKAGLYTSPGPWTCGGYVGAYQHEATDARKFAEWDFDFLKYDWCSYGQIFQNGDARLTNTISAQTTKGLAGFKFPYELMWGELQKQSRDIVFNLCQYGMGDVWKWGGEVGNSWRTTGDLGLERGSSLPGFYKIAFSNARHWESARPGAWNDPDYILIGWVGDAHGMGEGKKTTLTPNEQYSYMSLWSLMAAPLIFSGDMAKLDAFTLNVLGNAEVIEVDQDLLGKQAKILRQTREELVLVKELEDGSKAVGLFNLGSSLRKISVAWSELRVSGNQYVRDLWRQKEIGSFDNTFEMEVPRHGVSLVRLVPKQ
jgi:alpha-galactosidase